jgi:hypothetical protein
MSRTRIRTTVISMAASAVVCSGVLTACSVSKDDQTDPPRAAGTRTPTPTPGPSSSAGASTSPSATPSTSASPSTAPASTPEGALLTAAELPQVDATSAWSQGRTGPSSTRPFGLCQKFDLLTIGAESAVGRTFVSGAVTAGQQVAVFPDAQNAVRAGRVVEAWHRDCAGRVKGTSVKVRPLGDVAVPRGRAWWYLVSYERAATGHFHSLGLVVSGRRLTLLRMDQAGQDHDYDPGADPMELAVKTAAAKLG